jgi:hypothetical protein
MQALQPQRVVTGEWRMRMISALTGKGSGLEQAVGSFRNSIANAANRSYLRFFLRNLHPSDCVRGSRAQQLCCSWGIPHLDFVVI